MVYAYDLWALMPIRDIYDTLMMLSQVGAAKDMYEKAYLEYKEFRDNYSDFFSPWAKDMEYYQGLVNGVQNEINDLYKIGIDPLRSTEGRAAIHQKINRINPGIIAAMKANAKIGTTYLNSIGDLQSKNAFDQTAENMRLLELGIGPFDLFSTVDPKTGKVNMWTQASAIQFLTLKDATESWYKTRQGHLGTKEDVESFLDASGNKKYQYDPRYEYEVFTDQDLMNIARNNTPGWQGTFWSRYYRKLAEDKIKARGGTANLNSIERQLQRDIADAQLGYLIEPIRKADQFALKKLDYLYDVALEGLRHINKMYENATETPPKRGLTFKDDIYEKGLKNMIGADPTMIYKDSKGNRISMMSISNNSPDFYKEYKERIGNIVSNTSIAYGTTKDIPHNVVEALTHSKGLGREALVNYLDEKPLTKYGNSDVSTLGLVRLTEGDEKRLYTERDLGLNAVATVQGRWAGRRSTSFLNKNGKFDNTLAATTDTSENKGIVTAYINGTVSSFIPVLVYKDNKLEDPERLYYKIDYNSVKSSGSPREWEDKGISTIYDGKYDTSGQISSGSVDKWIGIGSSEIKSTAITP